MPAFLIKDLTDLPFVFIHNPKTGGQALRQILLSGQFDGPISGKLPEVWKQYFSFTFVRNPFDRLVSAWKMFSEGIEDTGFKVPLDLKAGMSLSEFLEIVVDESIGFGESDRVGKIRVRNHTLPQSHSYYQIDQAKFVGRFENYQAEVETVFERLRLKEPAPQHRHVTQRGPYHDYFDDATRQLASDYYADDLRKFDYEF